MMFAGAVEIVMSGEVVSEICGMLENGEVLLLPTDTVYGLCCDASNADAVGRLLAIKGRSSDTPLAVLVAGWSQARQLAVTDDRLESMDSPDWPAALTVVAPMKESAGLPEGMGTTAVGLRRPGPGLVADVVMRFGPIAASSANRHGSSPGVDVRAILSDLGSGNLDHAPVGARVDAFLDGGKLNGVASTVVELLPEGWRCLRTGSATSNDVEAIFGTQRE